MKAFFLTNPGEMAYGEIGQPSVKPGEVLLQVRRLGMCGTDLSSYRGLNPLVAYPRIPGHEIAATVVEVGADVPDHLRAGMDVAVLPYQACGKCAACRMDRPNACKNLLVLGVQRDGAFTEYITAPWNVVYPSSKLNLKELAMVEPLTIGFHALDRGRVTARDTVAVLGCGAIGLGVIAGAAHRGATVIAVDLAAEKLPLAKRAGATYTICSGSSSLHDELLALTDGYGPTVIIEAVGHPSTFRAAVDEVAYGGRVVYIGWCKGPVEYDSKPFIHKELDVLGSRNSLHNFPEVIEFLETGKFPVDEVVTRTVPFEEAGEALRYWSEHPAEIAKLHVTME